MNPRLLGLLIITPLFLHRAGASTENELLSSGPLSCSYAVTHQCIDYSYGYTPSLARAACAPPGIFSDQSPCSDEDRVGSCERTSPSEDDTSLSDVIRYYAPLTTSRAELFCNLATPSGDFTWN